MTGGRQIHAMSKGDRYHSRMTLKRLFCVPSTSQGKKVDASKLDDNEPAVEDEKKAQGSSDNLPIRRIEQEDDDYYDDFQSSGSKNSWKRYVSYVFGISLVGLFGWAGYSLTLELFGRGAPGNLFSETFEKVRYNDEILLMTGSPMKAYGQDTGRRSEGRRNHVANRYVVVLLYVNRLFLHDCDIIDMILM